jgi:hypothetical protein
MYKNNGRDSRKIKGCSPLQFSCSLIGLNPAIGYYSYTKRYQRLIHFSILLLSLKSAFGFYSSASHKPVFVVGMV